MPYEPLVLLHRLAPDAVNHLIRQNPSLPPVVSQQQQHNVQRCQNDGEGSAQPSEKSAVAGGSASRLESRQQIAAGSSPTIQVSTANSNDMVNSTAQHPKTRNSTSSAIGVNSNNNSASVNSAASSRDPTLAITNDTNLMMTSKSPLSTITSVIEVVDKKAKEVLINNHMTSEEHNSSGLSLRTRTISSTTAPISFHQSVASPANSVQLNCSASAINGRRLRGRRPRQKTLNRVTNGKTLQHGNIKKSDESKVCNSNSIITIDESDTSGLERLQQKQILNYCNGTTKYNNKQDNSNKTLSDKRLVLLPGIDKNKEIIVDSMCNKKSNNRKRKQCDSEESISKKRFLVSDSVDNSIETHKNPTVTPSLPDATNKQIIFGFSNVNETYYCSRTSSNYPLYGHTYWPVNWEYSAAALTGHVHKKVTKDDLRKIRQINSVEANNKTVIPKSNPNVKKSQMTFLQRRRSTNRLAASTSVEIPSCSKQYTSTTSNVVKRKKPGRPPGKNKLLQRVLKSNSPRKSPRQHASTLAIMSNKVLDNGDKLVTLLSDKVIDVDVKPDKKSLDMDRPCVLSIAVPKSEPKLSDRHQRHRRQLDHQHSILVNRRRKRRSVTPPPPKLSAQQPVSQRSSCLNSASIDQEVKLRTKHVDVVRRRARDERLRSMFVCQQLHKVYEIAEHVRQDLVQDNEDCQSKTPIPLDNDQNQIWSSQTTVNNHQKLDNMCLQIMYEQTGDNRFLRDSLTNETLQMYNQQRELAMAECVNNNYCGDNLALDLGADMTITGNKRKKKRPNMTGWPKEKRRKTIAATSSSVADVDKPQNHDRIVERRRKAAEQQRLRRQRIKLEQQQQLAKEKAKLLTASVPKRAGRRPGRRKKNRSVIFACRTASVSSSVTVESNDTSSSSIKTKRRGRKKNTTYINRRQNRKSFQDETKITASVPKTTVAPKTGVKRGLGRPKGSVGHRKKMKLEMLQRARNQKALSSDQQKENVAQQQVSSGKLKCVISTRNNRMKLLSSKNSFSPSNKKKLKIKKSAGACNTSSSSNAALPPSSTTVVSKSARITAKKKKTAAVTTADEFNNRHVGRWQA